MHDIEVLIGAAITIAFLHTVSGLDHYLPFIALSKSRKWSLSKTIFWTIVCGCGHIVSSVVLGLGGAAIGWSLSKMNLFQNVRGTITGWTLLGFGVLYTIWGAVRLAQNRRHKHFDIYDDGSVYVYEHKQGEVVLAKDRHALTPWVLFLIFVLGPCEPMIPLLYFPAVKNSWWGIATIVSVYTLFTLATMLLMVIAGYFGTGFFKINLEKYVHVLAGLTLFLCGAGIVFFSW